MIFTHCPPDIEIPKLKDTTTNGVRFYFDPKNPDVKWPSITTVLSERSKAPIQAWRKRVGEKKANEISKKATERGTSLHTLIEHYLQNEDLEKFNVKKSDRLLFKQTKSIIDKNINNILFQEQKLFSKTLKVAGRCDVIGDWNGKLSVIDFKSSNKRKREEWITSYFLQSTFYSFACWQMTGVLPKQIVVLISADDYTVIPYIVNATKYLDELKTQVNLWYQKYSIDKKL